MAEPFSTHNERGFTIIEVLVAIVLLLVGVLGVVTMLDSANAVGNNTKAREGATNVARHLLEIARTEPYDQIVNGTLESDIQSQGIVPDDDPGTPAVWEVNRRRIRFTVRMWSCIFDDTKDGARASNGTDTWCPGSAAAGSPPADRNPDDFRRIEVAVSWVFRGQAPICAGRTTASGPTPGTSRFCVVESELVPNPSGGLGPNIKDFTRTASGDSLPVPVSPWPTGKVIEQGSSMSYLIHTTSPASKVVWNSDDGVSTGTATKDLSDATSKTWTFTYVYPANPRLADGPHTLTLQAFLANVAGIPRSDVLQFNRFIPPGPGTAFVAPDGVTPIPAGGLNTRLGPGNSIVELNWNQDADNDILGYDAFRAVGATPTLSDQTGSGGLAVDPLACPFPTGASYSTSPAQLACYDPSPPVVAGVYNYYVVPFDAPWSKPGGPATPALYDTTLCPLLLQDGVTSGQGVNVQPGPPVVADPAAQRAGCPSKYISVNTAVVDNRPSFSGGSSVTVTPVNGLPNLAWPTATDTDGDPIILYRIYRNPSDLNNPLPSERYSTATCSATCGFIDPAPTGSNTYAVTAVDSHWQESNPIH